ncbi:MULTISPECIES: META domain-containing protein [Hymenobacter]|nr:MULTISPECIES: META domain-containing protein [Hymenobacter]MBC6991049.1 META domain-containing protein [Hymenobacter sp. BT491]
MRSLLILLSLWISCGLGLLCCQKDKDVATAPGLLDRRWKVEQVGDFPVLASSYSESAKSYIEFVSSNNTTRGLAPCNSYNGTFALKAGSNQISISAQAATKIGCPANALENNYLSALPQVTRYEIEGNVLRLYDDQQTAPRLVFRLEP